MSRWVPMVLALALFTTCSGETRYSVELDVHSFMGEDETELIAPVPDLIGLTIYLLPTIYLDFSGTGPDQASRGGIRVAAPSPADPPDAVELALSVRFVVEELNLAAGQTIPGTAIDVFIAGAQSGDIYAEGSSVFRIDQPALGPGQGRQIEVALELVQGEEHYELLQSGTFRIGIRHRIEPAAGFDPSRDL